MAMPQRDNVIEEIKRLDLLLEYAVEHGDEAEAARLREELKRLADLESIAARLNTNQAQSLQTMVLGLVLTFDLWVRL